MLNIALPKGRLGEKVYGMFEKAGFECPSIRENNRKLIFENEEIGVRYFWVKPSDVAIYVEHHAADVYAAKLCQHLCKNGHVSLPFIVALNKPAAVDEHKCRSFCVIFLFGRDNVELIVFIFAMIVYKRSKGIFLHLHPFITFQSAGYKFFLRICAHNTSSLSVRFQMQVLHLP